MSRYCTQQNDCEATKEKSLQQLTKATPLRSTDYEMGVGMKSISFPSGDHGCSIVPESRDPQLAYEDAHRYSAHSHSSSSGSTAMMNNIRDMEPQMDDLDSVYQGISLDLNEPWERSLKSVLISYTFERNVSGKKESHANANRLSNAAAKRVFLAHTESRDYAYEAGEDELSLDTCLSDINIMGPAHYPQFIHRVLMKDSSSFKTESRDEEASPSLHANKLSTSSTHADPVELLIDESCSLLYRLPYNIRHRSSSLVDPFAALGCASFNSFAPLNESDAFDEESVVESSSDIVDADSKIQNLQMKEFEDEQLQTIVPSLTRRNSELTTTPTFCWKQYHPKEFASLAPLDLAVVNKEKLVEASVPDLKEMTTNQEQIQTQPSTSQRDLEKA